MAGKHQSQAAIPPPDESSDRIAAKVEEALHARGGSNCDKKDCALPEALATINDKLDEILQRLAKGDTAIALLEHRVAFLEKIVYGLCGFVLLGVLGAVVALVIRSHP